MAAVSGAETMISRAVDYSLGTQQGDGSWQSPPDPRITETALGCLALSGLSDSASRYAVLRARSWLRTADPQRHHPVAEYAERLLAALAGEATHREVTDVSHAEDLMPDVSAGPVLDSRHRMLGVLRACGLPAPRADGRSGRPVDRGPIALADADLRAVRSSVRTALDNAGASRTKPWALVDLLAEHALLEERFGEREEADAAVRRLGSLQAPDGSFYGNPLSTSLACMALTAVAPASAAHRRSQAYILNSQQADGTWRFLTTDVWDTHLVVRAFRGEPAFDAQALGRALEFLYRAQQPDGGWPCRRGLESDNDTTAAMLLALTDIPEAAEAAQRALAYLARQQNAAGLWATWQDTNDPPAPDVIAHVLTALDRYEGRHTIATGAARRWLSEYAEHASHAPEGWSASWYRGTPYAVCEIAPALPPARRAVVAELRRLAMAQRHDGGWAPTSGTESLPSATGLALTALNRALRNSRAQAALSYLSAEQQDDGSWPGRPEMLGPRPLLSHSRIQTHAFTVMGLRAVRSRLRAPQQSTRTSWPREQTSSPGRGQV
ncbi:prenyltransferase/squalene oxidase repeat-containing protein [Streptomyces ochraceiscleroticus]|uniref:Prenyltransferase/squalene oxidase repeat-containing protein n=1 Tax=Streptomyces ochraceiscleroticus TaxID=47761 RepID=A0ABW1MJY9_9ACTN|nr:prenyltransferase/squalene oxidase repeat-containing protein [Streptomyces ochraceiscleroticus]